MDLVKLNHLALGQLLSLCITITNLSVTKLAELGVKLPLTINFLTYLSLSLIFGFQTFFQSGSQLSNTLNWIWDGRYYGLVLAIIDVEANYLVIKGFSYTSLLSAMLIGAWSTPMVVLLSHFLLGKRYRLNHWLGIALALLGLILLIFSDYYLQPNWWESDTLFGDFCCLLGATLYALSNVIQEKFIQSWTPNEFLLILGVYGSFISFIQLYVIERQDWQSVPLYLQTLSLVGFCVLGLVIFYAMTPHLIGSTSAAFFNISLLTSDFWSLLFGLVLFELKIPEIYPISFILVIYGLYLFNTTPSTTVPSEWHRWGDVNPSLTSTQSPHFNYEIIA